MLPFQSIPFTERDICICLRRRMATTKQLFLPGPFVKPNRATTLNGSGQTFEEKTAWALRNAPTEAEYKAALARVKRESPRAAKYFDDIKPHKEVFQYAMNAEGIATHGFKTSQIVESLNGVFANDARLDTP